MTDRRWDVQTVAERLAVRYEEESGRQPLDVGRRDRGPHERAAVAAAMTALEHDREQRWSFDFLSHSDAETRFIEVKGRGARGPIADVLDREYYTAMRLGDDAWLYAVYGCSGEHPTLYVYRNWVKLPWERQRPPRPEMLEDRFPPSLLPDKRSRSQRELDAEGRWSLPTEVVLEEFEAVLTG